MFDTLAFASGVAPVGQSYHRLRLRVLEKSWGPTHPLESGDGALDSRDCASTPIVAEELLQDRLPPVELLRASHSVSSIEASRWPCKTIETAAVR